MWIDFNDGEYLIFIAQGELWCMRGYSCHCVGPVELEELNGFRSYYWKRLDTDTASQGKTPSVYDLSTIADELHGERSW